MRLAALFGAAIALVFASGAAFAEGNGQKVGNVNQFRCQALQPDANGNFVRATDGSFCKWVGFNQNGQDSPLDANARALSTNVLPGDFAEAFTKKSLAIDSPAANVMNLSFDVRTADIQGGSPRISVVFTNPLADGSTTAFLSASRCAEPISSTWSRADFTGRTAPGCIIDTSNGTTFTSDGTNSAWDNLVAANPGAEVSFDFMVWDVPGSYLTDRISLGTGFLYNFGNGRAVRCDTEAAC